MRKTFKLDELYVVAKDNTVEKHRMEQGYMEGNMVFTEKADATDYLNEAKKGAWTPNPDLTVMTLKDALSKKLRMPL